MTPHTMVTAVVWDHIGPGNDVEVTPAAAAVLVACGWRLDPIHRAIAESKPVIVINLEEK